MKLQERNSVIKMYYENKTDILKDIFGSSDIIIKQDRLLVNGRVYPIVDDVIILLDPVQYPSSLRERFDIYGNKSGVRSSNFAEDIQFTFGEEWQNYPKILPEHRKEFWEYFDLIDLNYLGDSRVCDLGCGIGRWSHFLKDRCRELVMVDFSEAIFVARKNLKDAPNTLFFMADLKHLPFRENFSDFLFCLGVLHHLPTDALEEVRNLKKYSSKLLLYLYYSLDNRAPYFRLLLGMVTVLRIIASKTRSSFFRRTFTWLLANLVYMPLICLGAVLKPLGVSRYIPLYEGYHSKSRERIQQDVYDRFFTRIEQRFSKKQIMELEDTFSKVRVSENMPYWHFICER